jgi:hypothetical protein
VSLCRELIAAGVGLHGAVCNREAAVQKLEALLVCFGVALS